MNQIKKNICFSNYIKTDTILFIGGTHGNEKSGSANGNSPVPGNTGGGSSQGGSVEQVTKSLKGSTLAPAKNDSSSKSSSNITPSIAPEFKEAMEKYFKAIEDWITN